MIKWLINSKIKRILGALIVILIVTALSRGAVLNQEKSADKKSEVKSASEGEIEEKSISPEDQIPTPTPIPKQNQASISLKYPNSQKIGQEDGALFLESFDPPKVISDWYKEKIKSMGMRAKSFVQTSTNGNVLNSFVCSDGPKKVEG